VMQGARRALRIIVDKRRRGASVVLNKVGERQLRLQRADRGVRRLVQLGVIDPTQVARTALQNASVRSCRCYPDAMVAELVKRRRAAAANGHGMPGHGRHGRHGHVIAWPCEAKGGAKKKGTEGTVSLVLVKSALTKSADLIFRLAGSRTASRLSGRAED